MTLELNEAQAVIDGMKALELLRRVKAQIEFDQRCGGTPRPLPTMLTQDIIKFFE